MTSKRALVDDCEWVARWMELATATNISRLSGTDDASPNKLYRGSMHFAFPHSQARCACTGRQSPCNSTASSRNADAMKAVHYRYQPHMPLVFWPRGSRCVPFNHENRKSHSGLIETGQKDTTTEWLVPPLVANSSSHGMQKSSHLTCLEVRGPHLRPKRLEY
jgi:hypothetical protein